MAKFSQKMMGKEVGQAEKYAEPHTPNGKALKPVKMMDPNKLSADESKVSGSAKRVSAGDPGRDDVKTTGIETRGNGCATKGRIARGPMA